MFFFPALLGPQAVSQRAAAAVVRFLLYYPMTTSKLQSHLDWVLKNLKCVQCCVAAGRACCGRDLLRPL